MAGLLVTSGIHKDRCDIYKDRSGIYEDTGLVTTNSSSIRTQELVF